MEVVDSSSSPKPSVFRTILMLLVAAGATLLGGRVARSQSFNAANGHYYKFVPAANITWQAASAAAAASIYGSVHGHLATITSAAENAFVASLTTSSTGFVGAWFGATSTATNDWTWAGGPEAGVLFSQGGSPVGGAYVPWNPGEPNNPPGFAFMGIGTVGNGNWFDDNDGVPGPGDPVIGYFVEYEIVASLPVQLGSCFYQFVWRPDLAWTGAASAAWSMSYQGLPGHLATPASVSENSVLAVIAANSGIDRSSGPGAWLGMQIDGSSVCTLAVGPQAGVTISQYQTPINNAYVNWAGAEPDNPGGVAWMSIGWSGGASGLGSWHDDANGLPGPADPVVGFFVEYEAVQCPTQAVAVGLASFAPFLTYAQAVLPLPNGHIMVGYAATTNPFLSPYVGYVAEWDGTAWTNLPGQFGSGLGDVGVWAMAQMPNGDLVATGNAPGGVWRWNGTTWTSLGGPSARALKVLANGDLIAGAQKWDGASWSTLGTGTNGVVYAILELPGGDLLFGGSFDLAGGVSVDHIARWTGSSWTSFGNAPLPAGTIVSSLAIEADGTIVAAAKTPSASPGGGYVLSLQGSTWAPRGGPFAPYDFLGSGRVPHILPLNNGDLLVAGVGSAGHLSFSGMARLNRLGGWLPLGGGLSLALTDVPSPMAWTANGEIAIIGPYSGEVSLLSSSCPPHAISQGAGCAGPGGNSLLTATALPWVDGTFRARGSGLPSSALVLLATSVTLLAPGVPLSSVFSQALPGCELRVAPDILGAAVTTNGVVESSLSLPNSPPILGVTFYHQMIPFELTTGAGIGSITATNALQLTVGSF